MTQSSGLRWLSSASKKVPDIQADGICPENDAEIRQADRRAGYCFREDYVRQNHAYLFMVILG